MIATDAVLEANSTPTNAPQSAFSAADLKRLRIHTPESLNVLCAEEAEKRFVVEGLLAAGSVGILVGDSGLGKSPLTYQLALSVAASLPFLGMRTSGGPVVYMDCENGASNSQGLRDSLLRHLSLPECPPNFLSCCDISDIKHLASVVAELKPVLVVIDTLRSFDATAEKDNTAAGQFIKALRTMGNTSKTAFLLIHHVKKQDAGFFTGPPGIEGVPVIQWLNQSCGARGLINQTDVRIGVDSTTRVDASLVVRAHLRVQGEIGPFYLERTLDEDQQPIGYRRLSGVVELLGNKIQEGAFNELPDTFTFKDAKFKYGRQQQATSDFLSKCVQLGLVQKLVRGRYQKVRRAQQE
jgi:AAA domain